MPEAELPALSCEFHMQDTKLYQCLLGIQAALQVDGVGIDVKNVREGVSFKVSTDSGQFHSKRVATCIADWLLQLTENNTNRSFGLSLRDG